MVQIKIIGGDRKWERVTLLGLSLAKASNTKLNRKCDGICYLLSANKKVGLNIYLQFYRHVVIFHITHKSSKRYNFLRIIFISCYHINFTSFVRRPAVLITLHNRNLKNKDSYDTKIFYKNCISYIELIRRELRMFSVYGSVFWRF